MAMLERVTLPLEAELMALAEKSPVLATICTALVPRMISKVR